MMPRIVFDDDRRRLRLAMPWIMDDEGFVVSELARVVKGCVPSRRICPDLVDVTSRR